jgi:Helix-turn-helix family
MTGEKTGLGLARHAHTVLDLYHAVTYLAPQAQGAFQALGLTRPWSGYFAGRAAPLGAVGWPLVSALFYHFKPSMVAAELPRAWKIADPEQVLTARSDGADAALRALLGDGVQAPELAEAAELAAVAAGSCTPPARPLGAANAALPLPREPHLALWQALTTLREFRGDGHVTALAQAQLDGVEALVSITAAGGERRASIQVRRGWSDEEWAGGERRLVDRAWSAEDGSLTPAGRAGRQAVEDLTDRLALPAWRPLGAEGTSRLVRLVRPAVERIVSGLGLRVRLPGPAAPTPL